MLRCLEQQGYVLQVASVAEPGRPTCAWHDGCSRLRQETNDRTAKTLPSPPTSTLSLVSLLLPLPCLFLKTDGHYHQDGVPGRAHRSERDALPGLAADGPRRRLPLLVRPPLSTRSRPIRQLTSQRRPAFDP